MKDFLLKPLSTFWSIGAGVIASCLFMILAMTELAGQDMPFDEIPTAPASFLYLGRQPYEPHTVLQWKNIPLLTVTYVGALKSNLFGIWLRYAHGTFTVKHWRMAGIIFVAFGLLLFYSMLARVLPLASALVLGFLFVTDMTLLCYTRIDWGPMAFSLLSRFVWAALWLRFEITGRSTAFSLCLMGCIPALLVYEKLNNVVFILPLIVIVLASRELLTLQRLKYILAGIAIGSIPFILVNLLGDGISFRHLGSSGSIEMNDRLPFLLFIKLFLGLGAGQEVKNFILGTTPNALIKYIEIFCLHGFLLFGVLMAYPLKNKSASARIVVMSTAFYYLLALATWLIPRGTGIHHWIVSSPFQYLALAWLVPVLKESPMWTKKKFMRGAAVSALVIFSSLRIYNTYETEKSLSERDGARGWKIPYTALSQYVAAHYHEANFIAADYGFGAQIYCFSQGEYVVPEPFWNYKSINQIKELIRSLPDKPIYILYCTIPTVIGARKDSVLNDLHSLLGSSPLPIDRELLHFDGIGIEKFSYPLLP